MAVLGSLRGVGGAVWQAVFPPVCGGCGVLLVPHEDALCTACLTALVPLADLADLRYNPAALRFIDLPVVAGAASGFRFRAGGLEQRLAHGIKYGGNRGLGVRMGRFLGALAAGSPLLSEPPCCVTVPLSGLRLMRRGYNQSDFLAAGLRAAGGPPLRPRLLRRVRHTQSQTGLSRQERQRNVQGAFRAQGTPPACVLLLDDVLTTGATTRSAVQALAAAGVQRVYVLTLFRAED